MLDTNIAFLDFMDDSLEDSVRHLILGEIGVVSCEADDFYLMNELQNNQESGTMAKLTDVCFEKFELKEHISLHNFMFATAAHEMTRVFGNKEKKPLR